MHGLSVGECNALPSLIVRLRIVLVTARREYVLQLVATVAFIARKLKIIGACGYIGNGERIVLDIIARAGTLGIPAFAP